MLATKFIKVQVRKAKEFVVDSFRTVFISESDGIQAVMGKLLETNELVIQSYLFDVNSWDLDKAKKWLLSDRKQSKAEELVNKKVVVTASMKLCSSLPNLISGTIEEMDKKKAEAKLNDKYFFFTEGVHEGPNLNGDYFFKDELTENYRSAAYQPIDWEHIRSQIIGFTMDSQLITTDADGGLALGFNGVLNRLSPHMDVFEGDMTRDDIIKQRYFEGSLAVSMEALFDKIKCTGCGMEFDDFIEFEHHRMTSHPNEEVYRGLIGVDFIGFGVVEYPADPKAEAINLRTSDEGVLEDIVTAEHKEKFGKFAGNIVSASILANSEPEIELIDGKYIVFAKKVKKNVKSTTEKTKNIDKSNKEQVDNSIDGGTIMFKLAEKVAGVKTLSDIFVVAQKVLKDFMGDNQLSEDERTSFCDELSEVLNATISDDSFKVESIYTLTNEDKLELVTTAREEEKLIAEDKYKELNDKIEAVSKEKLEIESKLEEIKKENESIKEAETKKVQKARIDKFIKTLVDAGLSLTESMQKTVYNLAMASVDDEEKLKALHDDFLATFKQAKLVEGSHVMGVNTSGTDGTTTNDLTKAYEDIHKKYKEDK